MGVPQLDLITMKDLYTYISEGRRLSDLKGKKIRKFEVGNDKLSNDHLEADGDFITIFPMWQKITDEDKVAIRDYLENKSPDHSVTISVNTKGSTGVVNVVYHNDTTDHCYTYVVTDIYGNYLDRGVKKNMPSNAYWCHFLDRLVDKISQ